MYEFYEDKKNCTFQRDERVFLENKQRTIRTGLKLSLEPVKFILLKFI